ncbi:MAG: hypothetical protein ACYSW3_22500 [Planctomycetota bacterium]|jgi:hypothetical protein
MKEWMQAVVKMIVSCFALGYSLGAGIVKVMQYFMLFVVMLSIGCATTDPKPADPNKDPYAGVRKSLDEMMEL